MTALRPIGVFSRTLLVMRSAWLTLAADPRSTERLGNIPPNLRCAEHRAKMPRRLPREVTAHARTK